MSHVRTRETELKSVPVVELHSVLQQFFGGCALEDGFQRVQSCLGTVLYIQPVEQLYDITIQTKHPGRQQTRTYHLPHRFYNKQSDILIGHNRMEVKLKSVKLQNNQLLLK